MAYVTANSQTNNTSIDVFLGLNMSKTGATNLKLGESPQMVNWRITRDYKLEKMYGYKTRYKQNSLVRAIWFGLLGDTEVEVYVAGGKVYNKDVEIGTLTDDITRIFEFNKKLYFWDGNETKCWDGTTFGKVVGYVPLVKIATEPNGNGVEYEPINLLTGQKHQTFSPDGEAKEFYLVETDIDSVDKVLLDGVELQFTADLKAGKITVNSAPAQGVDSLDVWWTKGEGQPDLIFKNHYFQLYGLADDTRVFVYGNPEAKNRIYFSDLGNGLPDPTYFPGTNFIDIGSSNVAVTDIQRQYDRLIITKEDSTYYAGYEQITDTTGTSIITFPVNPLNKAHGAVAYNQGQVLDNYVTTIDTSIVQWTNTDTKDERNAQIISSKVEQWLNERNLSKSVTMDYQENKEYWLAIDNEILVYNYENQCYSLLKIPDKITSFIVKGKVIYAGTESGKIIEFDEKLTTYDGEIIDAEWQSGYYDFGIEERRKTMRVVWLTLKPWAKTSLEINYISDRDAGSEAKEVQNRCFSYELMNYAMHTYNTQYSVKPFRIKLKAKKFAFLKLTLRNRKKDEKVTVNSIAIKKAVGGEVK
jgi:hypothetical protein